MPREKWIDVLRGIAIFAVILDHTYFLFVPNYRQNILWWHTYFSIPWFIFLAGVTSVLSFRKNQNIIFYYSKRLLRLLPAYFAASLLLYLALNSSSFQISEFPSFTSNTFPFSRLFILLIFFYSFILSFPFYFFSQLALGILGKK